MINQILVTHAHIDHFGGVYDTIKLLENKNKATESLGVYKMLTDNQYERTVFERYPELRERVCNIEDNQMFEVEEGLSIQALHTPGHIDDHMSFLLREQKTLVTGDIILGSPSTAIVDLDAYIRSLGRVQQLADLEWPLLPHSIGLDKPDLIMVPAREKIAQYVNYRVSRLNELLDCFCQQGEAASEG